MDGFFLVDKPVGMTSHDVVRQVKHKFKLNKVGHTGTLDPFASGLLIICVGKATKISHLLTAHDKSYIGTIQFGKHYDSYDTTGKVLEEKNVSINKEQVIKHMKTFVGSYDQEPPMHSAIKIDGQKLYHLARQGKSIERPKRQVDIHEFELTDYQQSHISFYCHVSKGTYIRSLAVDLAKSLNTLGALSMLRRTSIGHYHIEQAKTLDNLSTDDLMTLEMFFKDHQVITLNDYMIRLVQNGVTLDERQITTDEAFVVHDEQGHLVAYYEPIGNHKYKPVLIC